MLLASAVALAGCTDSNYDLGDLDKTIGIGNKEGLALPGNNSTKEIVLDDLLDIDDSDVIATNSNGDYIFSKDDEGGVSAANPRVEPVVIKQEQTKDLSVTIPGLNITAELPNLPLPIDDLANLAAEAALQALPATLHARDTITMFNLATNHDETIVALQKVETTTAGNKSSLELQLNFSEGLRTLLSEIDKIIIDMPVMQYLDITASATNGATVTTDKASHTLTLQSVPTTGTRLKLAINALQGFESQKPAGDNYLVFSADSIFLSGAVELDVTIDKADMQKAGVAKLIKDIAQNHTTPTYEIGASTTIHDIEIAAAQGRFKPSATEASGKVAITSVPDFLSDDAVNIRIDNPQLYLDVASNMNIEALVTDVVITAVNTAKDGKPRSVRTVTIPQVEILPCTNPDLGEQLTHIVICDKATGLDEGYTPVLTNTNGGQGTLQQLITTIPDSIYFTCQTTANPNYVSYVKLGHDYSIRPSYRFKAPLALNKGSKIVYSDVVDGWNEDIDELELSNNAQVEVTANVVNGTPVDLSVTAVAIDANGRELDSNLISIEVKNSIKGATLQGSTLTPTTSPLNIVITQKSKDALKRLDGISYRAEATSNVDGIVLNSQTQKLRIQDIGIKVKGTVIKDLDD